VKYLISYQLVKILLLIEPNVLDVFPASFYIIVPHDWTLERVSKWNKVIAVQLNKKGVKDILKLGLHKTSQYCDNIFENCALS